MSRLSNKVAIVTGASSGIGRATAKLFAQKGAKLVVGGRRADALATLTAEIRAAGGEIVFLVGDVQEESYAKALVELALREYGKLDIAFNNAGTLGLASELPDLSLTAWNEILTTNLTSAFLGAKYQLPAMIEKGGSIIFTGSFVGYTVGMPQRAAYSASKAGVVGLTKSLASEYGPRGIRVNALLPGGTATPMAKTFGDTPETVAFVEGMHALKRMAQAEEIAQSALYLASDASSFTTGSAMLVDGGVSITRT